jgi:hypothetical protein
VSCELEVSIDMEAHTTEIILVAQLEVQVSDPFMEWERIFSFLAMLKRNNIRNMYEELV